jgi:hypothetical protein
MKLIYQLMLKGGFLCLYLAWNPAAVQAQSSRIALNLYAGVCITGAVSSVYAIEASTNLTQTNGWLCVAFVQLPAHQLFVGQYDRSRQQATVLPRRVDRAYQLGVHSLRCLPHG